MFSFRSYVDSFDEEFHLTFTKLALLTVVLVLFIKVLVNLVYNTFYHPVHHFPGPWFAAATPIPFAWRTMNGRMPHWVSYLHEKYGNVVRIHPDELSFVGHAAWQDIHKQRPEFPKPEIGMMPLPEDYRPLPMIINSEEHSRQKRILKHAFSDRALRDQEQILHNHSNTLLSCLMNQTHQDKGDHDTDICGWYYSTTFDIIGELCFGDSFYSLVRTDYHYWLSNVFGGIKIGRILTAFDHFPPIGTLIRWSLAPVIGDKLRRNYDWTREKVDNRLNQESSGHDFLTYILEYDEKHEMTRAQINSQIGLLLLTGSGDTTATAMTAVTYFALKTPGVMHRLRKEIEDAVEGNPEKLTVSLVSNLEYLDAVIREALRMHPPVPTSNPKVVNRPGVIINGVSIPQGTRVGIPQKAAYRNSSNFVEPQTFIPERWLPDPDGRFAADDKAVFEPFMVGPRSCLGKNLAMAEMKLILAKVFWHFELVLSEKNCGDWCDQKAYLSNEKKPLYVRLRPRTTAEV